MNFEFCKSEKKNFSDTQISILNTKHMKKILIIALLLIVNNAFSQFDETTNVFPVSPEAGKLGTYGDIPMNLSAGQMNFEVPIWEFDLNGYTWPVKLSYHYTGLILEEDPSLCGLGWTLIGGGVVTRQVRGLPDEHPDGYTTKTAQPNTFKNEIYFPNIRKQYKNRYL